MDLTVHINVFNVYVWWLEVKLEDFYVWTFDDISVVVFVSYSTVTVAPYSSFTFICQVKSSSQNHKSPLELCQEWDPA